MKSDENSFVRNSSIFPSPSLGGRLLEFVESSLTKRERISRGPQGRGWNLRTESLTTCGKIVSGRSCSFRTRDFHFGARSRWLSAIRTQQYPIGPFRRGRTGRGSPTRYDRLSISLLNPGPALALKSAERQWAPLLTAFSFTTWSVFFPWFTRAPVGDLQAP